jgi:TonB-dependent receptor
MQTLPRLLLIAAAATALILSPLSAQSPTATIEGRVFNAATGSALRNARIAVDGTARETLTDDTGAYRLGGLPAGEVRLSVSYLGFRREMVAVAVPPGGVVTRDVELRLADALRPAVADETVRMAEFTVTADREMSAQAMSMNEQRYAPNLKSVVAIDEYGDRGDENIGEFLRFLPSVALNDSGAVPNELVIRGFPSYNSSIMVDGAGLVGARSGATRALSLLEVPTGNVSRVEVTKVPTPDMPASGLGGSVNIISKGGFDTRKPAYAYQVYQMFHTRSGLTWDGGRQNHVPGTTAKYAEPSFNFSALYPLNRNLAFSFGGSRTWRPKPMEEGDDSDETATWDQVRGFQRISEWQSLAQIMKTWSAQAGADWRPSARATLSAGFQYRGSNSYITRSNFVAAYGTGAAGDATYTQGAATAVGSVTQADGANQDITTETTLLTLKYRHKADAWQLDASASWCLAEAETSDIDHGHFNTVPSTISNLILRGEGIPSSGGYLPTRYSATTSSGAPVDLYDGGNYSIGSGRSAQTDYNTEQYSGRIDVTRNFSGTVPVALKVGAAVDRTEKDLRAISKTWNFRPNGASTAAAQQARNFDVFDDAFNATAPTIYGRPMRWISVRKVYDLFLQHPDWFPFDEATAHQNLVTNSRRLIETVSAAYVRADARLLANRLWLVAGGRFEKTADKGWGARNDPSAQYRKDAAGNLIDGNPTVPGVQPDLITTDAVARAKLRYVERGTHTKRDYSGLYPSLSASFNVTDQLVLRGAYARTIGRPNVSLIVPGATFSEPTVATPTITVTNTGLKPWTADNFDLSLESYQIKDGFGAVGVFQKNIKNFFGSTTTRATPELLALYGLPDDDLYLNYDLVSTTNVGDAKITGVEFNYRQALTFLPAWARGFQVFFNASKMHLGGSTTADFTGFNPSAVSGGLNFIRPRYFIKLTCTHQGETRRGSVAASAANGIPEGCYAYQSARTRWGLSVQYSLTRRFALYGSATDLDGSFDPATLRFAPTTPAYARMYRYQELGSYFTLGVKGQF